MCIFCDIANDKKTEFVYQDNEIAAFKDINPIAPVHILIIPKRHIGAITEMEESDIPLLGKMIYAAKRIADGLGLSDKGYKLLLRVKQHGGQEVNHIHLHLIGGAPLYEEIRPLSEGKEVK